MQINEIHLKVLARDSNGSLDWSRSTLVYAVACSVSDRRFGVDWKIRKRLGQLLDGRNHTNAQRPGILDVV